MAVQTPEPAHETVVSGIPGSAGLGVVQDVPLNVSASPLASTASQKVGEVQETALIAAESMFLGADHEAPVRTAYESPPTATQLVAEPHEMLAHAEPGSCGPADHVPLL